MTLAGTNTIAAGNWTFGDIAGSDTLEVSGGNLTILGTSAEKTVGDHKYNTLTIGETSYAAAGSTTTSNPFSGTLVVSGGHFLSLSNYATQAEAALAQRQQQILAEAPDSTQKANLIYVGEQVHLNKAPTFASGEDNTVYVNLSSVAAHANYDKTQGIVVTSDSTQITGSTPTIRISGLTNAVVTEEADGSHTINFGNAFADSTKVDFNNDFYSDSQISSGKAEIVRDDDNYAYVRDLGLNIWGSLSSAINSFNTPTNPIVLAVYNNFGDWEATAAKAVAQSMINNGLFAEGTTVDDVVDALDNDKLESLPLASSATKLQVEDQIAAAEKAFESSLVNAEHAVSNMAAYSGAFSTLVDINNEITGALDRRSSLANLNVARNATGITPWVDVIGTWNTADGLYGKTGYEADIYGAVLGADWTASCGAILGAAVSVGQADANSVDSATKVENDADFWGLSVYGSHQIGSVNGKFDIGYVSVSNDLSANSGFFGNVKESLDASIFTVGLGAEYLVNAGAVNVVPHAGIRWSRLDMDDSKFGANYDAMNLFQMPVGVAFSGTIDMNGWKLAPMADVSVVPAFGDKDAVANFAGGITDTVRVVDTNPIQATLGLNAQVDAWTFGINYRLTAGGDDRLNNSLNANARYTF